MSTKTRCKHQANLLLEGDTLKGSPIDPALNSPLIPLDIKTPVLEAYAGGRVPVGRGIGVHTVLGSSTFSAHKSCCTALFFLLAAL
eukprot:41427-Eustigmatos_ZCMA.PRE.1